MRQMEVRLKFQQDQLVCEAISKEESSSRSSSESSKGDENMLKSFDISNQGSETKNTNTVKKLQPVFQANMFSNDGLISIHEPALRTLLNLSSSQALDK